MATWYVDHVGGNDANAGTSFALRCKTVAALTAKGLAAGDTVRVMASSDPVNTGVTANVTNNNATVTLSAAVNKDVSTCATVWSGGAGVTYATTATCKEGTLATQLIIGGGYVNGTIMGYKALGASTDFSAYQQVCLWFKSTATAAASDFRVDLCSDVAGAVAVNSINIPAYPIANIFMAVVVDTGGALGAAIQSVSITRVAGAGTPTVTLDNIFTSKAPGSADELTLYHLIGSNVDMTDTTSGVKDWYRIGAISGTAVGLDWQVDQIANMKWQGLTNSALTLYARKAIPLASVASTTTAADTVGSSGTAASPIVIQGGYNTSDMTSITGDTYLLLPAFAGYVFGTTANNKNYVTVNNMGFVGGATGLSLVNITNYGWTVTSCHFAGTQSGFNNNNYNGIYTISNCSFVGGATLFQTSSPNGTITNCRFNGAASISISLIGPRWLVQNCAIWGSSAAYGVSGAGITGNGSSANTVVRNCTFNNTNGDIWCAGGPIFADNCLYNSSVENLIYSLMVGDDCGIYSTNHDQVSGNHRQTFFGGIIASDTANRRTASGIAWKFSPTNTIRSSIFPLRTKIATVYCVSGTQTTVSAYFAKDHANISIGLWIIGGQLGGPASDTTTLSTCATTSTYESTATQIQWTPTSTGWVEIEAICYTSSSTTSNGWVDDFGCVYG